MQTSMNATSSKAVEMADRASTLSAVSSVAASPASQETTVKLVRRAVKLVCRAVKLVRRAVKHVRRALYSTVRHAESSPKHHDALCCFAADIDECSTTGDGQACGFGGTCIDGVNSYTCLCTPQYTGNECSLGKRNNVLLRPERQGTETMKCACDVNHNSLQSHLLYKKYVHVL